jgi:hypothetical protein
MLTLRDHNVSDYASLRDMDTTDVAVLDEADRACLDELGRYLVSTDAWRRFAIWLLHKHFEPAPGEVFVERAVGAARGTQTTLVARCSARDLSATSLRFDPDVSSGVVGMEFAGPADFGPTPPLNHDDEAVLTGIAERLRAHGRIGRFGARLIRNPLGLSEREVLVETCDIARRTLRCGVGERNAVGADNADNNVETTWQWKPNGPDVTLYCMMMCGSDPDGSHYIEGHITSPD